MMTVIVCSCGTDGGSFRLKGEMKNMNQAEFYIFATTGASHHIDTIHVQGGRFTYTVPMDEPTTMTLLFPNFSDLPIFGKPGKTATLMADASHLSEAKVSGTDENESMTDFRLAVVNKGFDYAAKEAEKYITSHPESPVSLYLLQKYYILAQQVDSKKAYKLADMIAEAQPDNGLIKDIKLQLEPASKVGEGSKLPKFSVSCIDGTTVSDASFAKGNGVIMAWASWNYESQNWQSSLRSIHQQNKKMAVLTINLDGSRSSAEMKYLPDSLRLPVYHDGRLFEGELVRKLGIMTVPEIIFIKDGKIVKRGITVDELRKLSH